MWKRKLKYVVVTLLISSLLLSGCAGQPEPEDVVSLTELNFEFEDFIGEKIWVSGFYGDDRFTDDGVGFLVADFHMLIVDEKLPDHSFARLDGDLPPYDMNGAEILVYGEVKDFAQTYDVFTLMPTPLITVEQYRVVDSPEEAVRAGQGVSALLAGGTLFQTATVLAQEDAATGTKARDCDRALIIGGGIDANNKRKRFEDNIIAKYKKLKELGYTDEQIGVFYDNGSAINIDGTNIVDGKASKQKIKGILEKYKTEMPASCTLSIFVTDHGKGYNEEQGYHGARPAFSGIDSKTKTYPESTFELDLCRKVYVSYSILKTKSNEWDTDGDGEIDVKAECDTVERAYVLKRKLEDGTWQEIGKATGDTKSGIKCKIKGVDWNLDGDRDDQVGFHEGINLWGNEVLWDDELAQMLKPVHDKGIHIFVEMSQCFGGGFIDNLEGIIDKIVTFSDEDTKHHNRKDATGKTYAADQKAFVKNLAGIDIESWDKAFDKAKEADRQKWEDEGSNERTKNEYKKWEKTLIQTGSTFYEDDGKYTLTLKIPESLKDKVYDIEIFFGLQKPRWDVGEVLRVPEGFSTEEIAGGIKIKSTEPFSLTPLVFKFMGAKDAGSFRIHVTDKEHKNLGYIIPTLQEKILPPAEEVLGITVDANTNSFTFGSLCRSILAVDFDVRDLTGGEYLITRVVLKVNKEVWHDSGTVSTVHYQELVDKQVFCGNTFDIEVVATNEEGQTLSSTHFIETPIPPPLDGTVLTAAVRINAESISDGSGCYSILTIYYDARDLTGGDIPVTNVILKVNEEVWLDSGGISTEHYNGSLKERVDCGETFLVELVATNRDGQTATATEFIITSVS